MSFEGTSVGSFRRLGCGAGLLCLIACSKSDDHAAAQSATRSDAAVVGCTRDADCRGLGAEAVCVESAGRCASLRSPDCAPIAGPTHDEHAILLGALFSTSDAQAATNMARQQSAQLAIEEIDQAGGLPPTAGSSVRRPIVLVACDEAADLKRASQYLIETLSVPAIIGPNTSQDTLDLAQRLSIASGTLLISPTAVVSSIADLLDDDLSWLMVPNDAQRAPLMIQEINQVETQLRAARGREQLKLSIVFRNDVLGNSARASLNGLQFNHESLADPANLSGQVLITPYSVPATDQAAIVQAQREFAPDIVVLIGTAEAVRDVMGPLEHSWPSSVDRPHYILTDSSRVPELLELAGGDAGLRQRVRGVGVSPTPASQPSFEAFRARYRARFDGEQAVSGMGPSYDSAYALAYALAAIPDEAPSGLAVARGLRRLASGDEALSTGPTQLSAALQALATGASIQANGTFAPLDWDEQGAALSGALEVWCVATEPDGSSPVFIGSGLTQDVASGELHGSFSACETSPPDDAPAGPPSGSSTTPSGPSAPTAPPGMPSAPPPPPSAAGDAAPSGGSSGQPDATADAGVSAPPLDDPNIVAQYSCSNKAAGDNLIAPDLMLTNVSAMDGVRLSAIRLRYYFTNENAEVCPDECVTEVYWAGILPAGRMIQAQSRYVALDDKRAYLEVSFSRLAPMLAIGESVEVQQAFHTMPYRDFNERDDYSFDPTKTAYAEWRHIAVYRGDMLIWGAPPP